MHAHDEDAEPQHDGVVDREDIGRARLVDGMPDAETAQQQRP